jgi:hypothetical protein
VDTSELVVTADGEGRFRIEGIPSGEHYLAVEHPLLDTLGIRLRSASERYAADEARVAELATPAPETLIGLFCSAAWRARGPAALVGRVREADTGNPAAGAKVSLVWYELAVEGKSGGATGLRRAPRVREVMVGEDGTYRICGLPGQLDGRAQVIRGQLTSGDIPIAFGHDLLAMRSMSIASPGALVTIPAVSASDSTPAIAATVRVFGTARLTGRVLNKTGRPLSGARVQLEGTTRAAVTRPTGDFVLDSLPPGTQTVTVRLLGYSPIETPVDLSNREARNVTIAMEDFVPVLETIRVTAQRERALLDVGYENRKRTGQGWYMDGAEIQNRNALNFSDILRSAPGIRVTQHMGRQAIENSRDPIRGCVTVWIDGTPWQQMEAGDIDGFLRPHEVAAIEVYSSSTTPVQYQQPGRGSCTTVLAWTFRRLDRKR